MRITSVSHTEEWNDRLERWYRKVDKKWPLIEIAIGLGIIIYFLTHG